MLCVEARESMDLTDKLDGARLAIMGDVKVFKARAHAHAHARRRVFKANITRTRARSAHTARTQRGRKCGRGCVQARKRSVEEAEAKAEGEGGKEGEATKRRWSAEEVATATRAAA